MTCWGKWNVTWHFISTLFCWCLSTVETLIEQLHAAWDVQSCLFALKLVVQRKEWSRSLMLRSAQVCSVSRLRHGNRSWSRPLESMLVLGLYQHVSEPSQKRLSKAFIQRSVMPQRWSKRHLLFEFAEKNKRNKYCIRSVHMRTEPKDRFGANTCTVIPPVSTKVPVFLYDIPCYRDEHALKFEQLCQTSSANVVYMWNGSILSHVSNKLLCVRCAAVIRFGLRHLAHSNPNMISDHNYICVIFHSYFVQNSNPY